MTTIQIVSARLFSLLLAVFTVLAMPAYAQAPKETLTNDAIIELTKLGFGEALIIEKIQHSSHEFDTSLSSLKKLKEAGVSDGVIKAMVSAPSASAKEEALTVEDDPTDPISPHEPGIYCWMQKPDGVRLVQLEPSVYSQSKAGGWLESQLTYGLAKTKLKAVVPRPRARLRLPEARPIFYFYFEQKSAGLSYSHSFITGATNPNEFVLVKMKEKRDSREVTTAESNIISSSSGTSSADTKDFDFEKIRPGIYKVIMTTPLEAGEYCFFYAGGQAERLFDFGIESGAEMQIMRVPEETAPARNSSQTKRAGATEPTWLDEPRTSKVAKEEKPIAAKILEIKKGFLIIDFSPGNRLSPGIQVMISLPERGATSDQASALAEVIDVKGHHALLKMKNAGLPVSFAVGGNLVLTAMR